MHVLLQAGLRKDGSPVFEPVHVEQLGGRRHRVLFTPGLVYGIAAGDLIDLGDSGDFNVVLRGGNFAVRVYSQQPIAATEPDLTAKVKALLGGTLDGQVEKGLAYSISSKAGFTAINRFFDALCSPKTGLLWEYGNVYAEDGTPINWWRNAV